MQNAKNKNIIAVAVGFLLIFFIAIITFYKSQSSQKSSAQNPPAKTANSDAAQIPAGQLSSGELMDKINSKQSVLIIDTRSADDFKKEHILDSKNIPLGDMGSKLSSLDKAATYVIVDDGTQSGLSLATQLFPQNGIKNAYYLDGGFPDWKSNNEPTVSAGDPASFTDQSKVNYLNSDQLKAVLANETNLAIIDLRSADNYKEGHLPGAINIFVDDLESQRNKIPVGKKIILYDKDGLWAFQGSVRLFDMGFFNVFCLSDGLDAWQKKNYPLVK